MNQLLQGISLGKLSHLLRGQRRERTVVRSLGVGPGKADRSAGAA
jgi:hypothetical protein